MAKILERESIMQETKIPATREKGFILAVVLILLVILFIFGTAFIAFTQSDMRFAKAQEYRISAFYIAKSGLHYYLTKGLPLEKRVYLDDSRTSFFDLELKGNLLYCTGFVSNEDGKVLSKRTLVTPLWDMGIASEVLE